MMDFGDTKGVATFAGGCFHSPSLGPIEVISGKNGKHLPVG